MANTVTTLSYANTFGDWIVITDQLSGEVNTLGFGNYVKNTGLLTLAGSGTGLQVTNNAIIQGGLTIQGTGQALQVNHDALITGNLTVMGNTIFEGFEIEWNDITSNTIHANTVTVNTAIGGTNHQLNVSTDMVISGNLVVVGNTTLEGFEIDWNDITSNTIHANTITINHDALISGNLTVIGNANISMNEIVTGNITANFITANGLYGQANVQITQQISDSQNTSVGSALAFSIALG
jgi:polyisoprenoid-binding protein YceI